MHRARHILRRAPLALPRNHLVRGVTTYTYHADGRVEHSQSGEKLVAPLSAEAAGDRYWQTADGVDKYLDARLSAPDFAGTPALARGLERAEQEGLPAIAVTPMFGQLMSILVKAMRAERVLEIGTLGGYSTFFFAEALPTHGQIDTIEADPKHAQVAQRNFIDLDLYPFLKTHVGKALEVLRDPKGPFAQPPGASDGLPASQCGYDIVFVDANKDDYFEYFVEGMRLARPGGVIVFDNAIRQGRIAVPEDVEGGPDPDIVGLRKIFDWIEKDKGKTVLASAIQTVGEKSWDGFAIVYKK